MRNNEVRSSPDYKKGGGRLFLMLFAITIIAILTASAIDALDNDNGERFSVDGIVYEIKSSSDVNVAGDTYFGDIVIPSSVSYKTKTYNVTGIGDNAFLGCVHVSSVKMPDSVKTIGNNAFSGCVSLTSITIPDNVTSIGNNAFLGCRSITSVTIPAKTATVSTSAFMNCGSLSHFDVAEGNTSYSSENGVLFNVDKTKIVSYPMGKEGTSYVIPTTVTSIEQYAFNRCGSLTTITIPEGTTKIDSSAFSGCSSLVSMTIPNSVKSIAGSAFAGCGSLTSVTISNTANTLGKNAFNGCSSLTSVTIPGSITSIPDSAFSGCTSLGSVTIGEGTTTISESAFSGCTALTSVSMPNSLKSIGGSAFANCTSLKNVTIPVNVNSISSTSFSGCTALTHINVDGSNTTYSSSDGVVYNHAKTTIVVCPVGKAGACTILDNVTEIGYGAFNGCSSLTSITIPSTVTKIGNNAFKGCTALTDINVHGDNPNYSSSDGVLFNKNKNELILYPVAKREHRTPYLTAYPISMVAHSADADPLPRS